MKVNFNKKTFIFKLLDILFIVIFISIFLSFAIYIRKIYILKNSYKKYEKSVIAEIVSSNKVTHVRGNRNNRISYHNVVYTVHINETDETLKITDGFSNIASYKDGEKILLNYYGIYDKHSNKYLEKQYSIKPLYYFDEGSFLGLSDKDSLFFNNNYPNSIFNFKSNNFTISVSKEQIWIFKENEEFIGKITSNIDTTLINFISNRKSEIDITKNSLGTVYDFNYTHWHYSILNYGSNLNNSIVLMSSIQEKLNIMNFITE